MIFTAAYILVAGVSAWMNDNKEFIVYIAIMGVMILAIMTVHRRCDLSRGLLWSLSIWGLLHMAGGLVPGPEGWPDDGPNAVLYLLWLIPEKLKDDQVVHTYGFGITTWLCWQELRAGVLGRFGLQLEPTAGMMVPRESGVDVRSSLCHRSLNGVGVRTGWYYEYNEEQFPYTPNVRALGADDWKYIRYPYGDGSADKHMAELYDLKHDVEERHNLINDPEHKELDRLIAESGAGQDKEPMDEGIKGELPDEKIR